jgi:predicted  nucleic acid-binding Zn-ribbon protein
MLTGVANLDHNGTLKRSTEIRREIQSTQDSIGLIDDQIELERAKLRQSEGSLLDFKAEWQEQTTQIPVRDKPVHSKSRTFTHRTAITEAEQDYKS